MPTKQLPDQESFQRFVKSLEDRGFRPIKKSEYRGNFQKRQRKVALDWIESEAGFIFFANGLEVVVWSTFLKKEGRARDVDAGWVLIREGDKVLYFSPPRSRTRHFLNNLLWDACIARQRVLNRPLCPYCSAWMHIAQGRGFKSRYWKCTAGSHKEPVSLSWDHGLPPEALLYLKKKRKKRAAYRKKLSEEGKEFGAALEKRIGKKIR